MAEESELILPLGEWVLGTASRQAAQWGRTSYTSDLSIAVNISARQFRERDFVKKVLATLQLAEANPRNLEIELTESTLVDDVEQVSARMSQLKSYGLRFSIDDFGTGYSSLSYLKRLPIDKLKIDGSFVREIVSDLSSSAIVRAIISICSVMNIGLIAEDVETVEQRDCLLRLGCGAFQGFLYGKPMNAKKFERFAMVARGKA